MYTTQREMFEIKCSDCGKAATVPFEPKAGKPVYCRTCFSKYITKRTESITRNSGFDPKQAWARRRDGGEIRKEKMYASVFQQH
jgi:CxxC-x17-CxxC domain-containing protein